MGTNLPCPDCGKDIYFCECTVETRTLRRRIRKLEEQLVKAEAILNKCAYDYPDFEINTYNLIRDFFNDK